MPIYTRVQLPPARTWEMAILKLSTQMPWEYFDEDTTTPKQVDKGRFERVLVPGANYPMVMDIQMFILVMNDWDGLSTDPIPISMVHDIYDVRAFSSVSLIAFQC